MPFRRIWTHFYFSTFVFLFIFRDQTTAQSVLTLRMVQTVWRNVPMAYRELTVSSSSTRIRIGNATHAIPTAPKGKHPSWPRAKPWTCFQFKGGTYVSVSVMMSTCITIASGNIVHRYNLHVDFKMVFFLGEPLKCLHWSFTLRNSFMKPVLFGCSLETAQSLQQTLYNRKYNAIHVWEISRMWF